MTNYVGGDGEGAPDTTGKQDLAKIGAEAVHSKGGFLGSSDRPYKNDMPGQLETRGCDTEDKNLFIKSASVEEGNISLGKDRNAQHGNVGFSGNYSIGPVVEK